MECIKCGGEIVVRTSRISGSRSVQYLRCKACGDKPQESKRVLHRFTADSPELIVLRWCEANRKKLPEDVQHLIQQIFD